jgi:[acyl-carrier-protein] S-malonyltransferase/trans-AT polyketide synthase/acyltransferase/oxidoreductase domain-containing protein
MGKDFIDRFPAAREAFAEGSDALHIDLGALCFEEDPRLDRTEFTQPAILVTEIAMFRALRAEYGLTPAVFGGHSLGEYTALCAAGAMPLSVAAPLVRRRGALMQAVVPEGQGAMVAIVAQGVAERDLAAELAGIDVDVANRNSPNQVVLSGPAGAIERAVVRAEEILNGVEHEIVRLNVSAPFHSRGMRPMEADLRAALAEVSASIAPEHAIRVTSNLTGGFHVGTVGPLVDALVGQASGTVDWIANMRALAGAAEAIYEIGPGRPLRGFFRAIGREVASITTARNLPAASPGLHKGETSPALPESGVRQKDSTSPASPERDHQTARGA